jgi:hypothetical protein
MKGTPFIMKRYLYSTFNRLIRQAAFIITVVFLGAGVVCASEIDGKSGFHFDWWDSDEGDSGMQFYIPVQAATRYRDISFEVLTAYAYTQVDPSGGSKRSLSDFVDTKLNISYEMLGRFGCDMLFGLGFNLPTGHTDLSQRDLVLFVPADLVSIKTFGEGLNINPRLSIARQWDKLVAGVGAGYTWRSEYDYSDGIEDYDPGDIFTLTSEVAYEFSPQWNGKVYGEYASYGKDTVDGDDYYQEGDVTLIGFGLRYERPAWDLGFNMTSIFRGKSKIQQGTVMPTEDRNSHGNEWISEVVYRYFLDKDTTASTSLEYMHIKENKYPESSPYYIGKRSKITLGCGLAKSLKDDIEASAEIKGFIMNDDSNWYHPGEDYKYTGFSLGAQVSKGF